MKKIQEHVKYIDKAINSSKIDITTKIKRKLIYDFTDNQLHNFFKQSRWNKGSWKTVPTRTISNYIWRQLIKQQILLELSFANK